jgi:Ferritin-like domain/DoxX
MFEWLLHTEGGVVGLILRLTLAVVLFPHGAQKVFGWFGGHGFKNTLQFFTSSGIPVGFALLGIAAVVGDVAERALALGAPAVGTPAEFVQHARLKERPGHYPDARAMLANLLADREAVIQRLWVDLGTCADEHHDIGTNDFLTGLMAQHEKMAWV